MRFIGKVLHALLKKKYLLTRADLVLEWEPLLLQVFLLRCCTRC
jgi:hypothetical protein